ncbi:DUF3048 domain-containing protein [Cytobacillus depressus]|uniref:DUF3048 domain-containing protein n=1 Tax=Cytobacillus depressus TaxID=1602942 RepID=A0A6L3V2P2_9BACI|nr:DUF3048 domain-containing protein [Cytobacillus depressus]KAB2331186.1 DUF3048 domain-containing protein [Cytobacillus depressus]
MLKKWLAGFAAAILLVSGCSKNDQTVIDEDGQNGEEQGKTDEQIDSSNEVKFPYQFPLTGMGTDKQANGRAIAVMINNHPEARPQSGLGQADIVYELLAEGDVTRFLAIYQSEQPEKIGPIRSARDYYIELAKGYDSLYIAHGYSPDAKELLDKGYIDNLNGMAYDGTLFYRATDRKAPHNSYSSFENFLKGAEQRNYQMNNAPSKLSFLTEKEVEALHGEEAKSVMVSYFNSKLFNSIYEYDEALQKYKRYSNGELTADHETGEPVLIDNIFIVETDHQVIDNAGRRAINLTSGGRGYLLQKGQWREVKWQNIDGRILPVLNGQQVGFVPGKTWINVVPSNPGLEQTVSFDVSE